MLPRTGTRPGRGPPERTGRQGDAPSSRETAQTGRSADGSGSSSAKTRQATFEERWAGPRPGSGHGRNRKSHSERPSFHVELQVSRSDLGPVPQGVLAQPLDALVDAPAPRRILDDADFDRFSRRPEVGVPGREGRPRRGRDDRVVGSEDKESVALGVVREPSRRQHNGGSDAPKQRVNSACDRRRRNGGAALHLSCPAGAGGS